MVTLRIGSKCADVNVLQNALTLAGCELEVDGVFGKETKKCVEAFQASHALTVDGIVGPKTWTALEPYIRDSIVESCRALFDKVESLPEYKLLEALLYG